MEQKQILSTLVRNHPGVLLRVAGLFSRRGFNIESLTASETQDPAYSRMTIVVSGDIETVEQVKHQLEKIIDVKKVAHFKMEEASCSELLLVKVKAMPEERTAIDQLSAPYHARVVDVGLRSLTLEATGKAEELNGLVDKLQKWGILEMARSGFSALQKGDGCLLPEGEVIPVE